MDSVGNIILYFIVATAIIVFSVLTVTTKRILRAATYLLFVLIATGIIYFQLDFHFLGAVQIAVYAGGIAVLFVFAIMLTHKPGNEAQPIVSEKRILGMIVAAAGALICGYGLFSYAKFLAAKLLPTAPNDYDIASLGRALLDSGQLGYGYLLPFEAISVLLLACIIGGVVIARRR